MLPFICAIHRRPAFGINGVDCCFFIQQQCYNFNVSILGSHVERRKTICGQRIHIGTVIQKHFSQILVVLVT